MCKIKAKGVENYTPENRNILKMNLKFKSQKWIKEKMLFYLRCILLMILQYTLSEIKNKS
jgi:hypothetical protein